MIDFEKIPSPCFVLEERLLTRNMQILDRVQKEAGIEILVALKGFAMWSTFPLVKQYLSGATASSLNEAKLCFEEFGKKAHLCFPIYLEKEMHELISISNHITFNTLSQFEKYKHLVLNNPEIECAIRVNPEYSEVATDLYNPCVPGSRLGTTRDKLPDILPEGITGIHFHSLCGSDSYALERTLKALEEKFGDLLKQASWLNMGGGHHITRSDYNVDHLISLLKYYKEKYNLKIYMEPGEAVGWQTGFLVSRVQDIIESKGIYVAMLDVSVSAHMPDCIEMPYKPKILGASDAVDGKKRYRMGGMTCLAGDYIGDYNFPDDLKINDIVVFDDMIHYTMVKTTFFNGIQHPSIGIWKENDTFQLVREFGYDSYKYKLS